MQNPKKNRGFYKGRRVTRWCFTLNNPKIFPSELEAKFKDKAKYLVFQMEEGEDKTRHFQGYVRLKTNQRLSYMKKILPRAHWIPANGSDQQNKVYCTKEDGRLEGPWELGEPFVSKRGKRTDLVALYLLAKSDAPLAVIAEQMPGCYMRHHRAVKHIRHICAMDNPGIREDLKIYVLLGEPGTGKTAWAYAKDSNLFAVPVGKDIWYDGYGGQATVLLDDFSGQMRLVDILRVLDKYPVQVPIKGSFVFLHCTKIIITTNVPIEDWYDYTTRQDSLQALMRRVHRYYRCTKEGSYFVRRRIVNGETIYEDDEEEMIQN